MLEIIFYILYKGFKIENPRFDNRKFYGLQIFFIAQQCVFIILLILTIIDKLNLIILLNEIANINANIKEIRLIVIIFSILISTFFNYYTIFRKDKRDLIINKYDGKYLILVKYSHIIGVFFIFINFSLIFLLDLF